MVTRLTALSALCLLAHANLVHGEETKNVGLTTAGAQVQRVGTYDEARMYSGHGSMSMRSAVKKGHVVKIMSIGGELGGGVSKPNEESGERSILMHIGHDLRVDSGVVFTKQECSPVVLMGFDYELALYLPLKGNEVDMKMGTGIDGSAGLYCQKKGKAFLIAPFAGASIGRAPSEWIDYNYGFRARFMVNKNLNLLGEVVKRIEHQKVEDLEGKRVRPKSTDMHVAIELAVTDDVALSADLRLENIDGVKTVKDPGAEDKTNVVVTTGAALVF